MLSIKSCPRAIMILKFIILLVCATKSLISANQTFNGTYWNKQFINSGVNPSIVGSVEPSKSVLGCAIQCERSSQYISFYYSSSEQKCYCNTLLDGGILPSTVNTGLTYGIRNDQQHPQSRDCLDLYQNGAISDGVYMITPGGGVPVEAWCDMTGGGWTVIQRRQDGSVDFYRLWNEYVNGFGIKTGEYWLGLENIHLLTQEPSTLRVDLESITLVTAFAEYFNFIVESAGTFYRLSVSGFSGTSTDALTYHHGMMFSTADIDNDYYTLQCAAMGNGAWWYNNCYYSNLNGGYGGTIYWDGLVNPLKTSVMKIRRNVI